MYECEFYIRTPLTPKTIDENGASIKFNSYGVYKSGFKNIIAWPCNDSFLSIKRLLHGLRSFISCPRIARWMQGIVKNLETELIIGMYIKEFEVIHPKICDEQGKKLAGGEP